MSTEGSLEEIQKKKAEREDIQYDQLEENQKVGLLNGFFTFTKNLKYLGSYIPYNLRDNFDIVARIMSSTKVRGALKIFWGNPHVDTYSKYLIL